jgi:N6-adenosine-specific RNA methylase IME4
MIDIADQLRAYAGPPVEVLYADPPWRFSANRPDAPRGDAAHGRNASRHYPTMRVAEICALPVASIMAKDALCALWITGPFMAIGVHVEVLRAWGFKPRAVMFTWVKLRKNAPGLFLDPHLDLHVGNGFTTRKNCEWIMLGARGRSLRASRSIHEVGMFPVREHSRKPDEFRERIDRYVGPGKTKVEMFARTTAPGWLALGNETEKF